MELNLFDSSKLIIAVFIALVLHILFLRRFIISFLDPWLFMFLAQIMIIAVFIYSFWTNQIPGKHFCYVIGSWFGFIVGLSVFYKKTIKPVRSKVIVTAKAANLSLKFYLILFLINSCFIFYFMGIPLFINGPRLITAYSEMGSGFGILYYANWGLQSIITMLGLREWLINDRKGLGIGVLVCILIFNTLNGGSKAGYLDMTMLISLAMYFMKRNYDITYQFPKFFKVALYLLPFYILFSFASAVSSGYESNVFFALIRRTVGSAEGPFYYFVLHSYTYFKGLNVLSYHFSQILPYFGYVDKEAINLGVNLSLYSDLKFGTQGMGANPTMYVIGHIAFGNFGIIYCFFIGTILSYFRFRMKASFLIWMFINATSTSLVTDGTLMPVIIFYVLLLSPIIIISIILTDKSIFTDNSDSSFTKNHNMRHLKNLIQKYN